MSALISISKVPAHVLIDVLPLLASACAPPLALPPARAHTAAELVQCFADECLVESEIRAGAKLNEVHDRFLTWCEAKQLAAPHIANNRALASILRSVGFQLYRGHCNFTAISGHRLR